MRFYRVSLRRRDGEHAGYVWTRSRAAAITARVNFRHQGDAAKIIEIDEVDIEPTAVGILHALNMWASHPDNG